MTPSNRHFNDRSVLGMRSRPGFAMFMALGALVIIGVLIAGSSFLSLQETRLGQNQIVETRAFTAAEFGLNKIQADWDKTPNLKMANGASFDTSYAINARDTVKVRYTRLNNETFWIVSEGRAFAGTAFQSKRTAVKRVGAILRLRVPSINAKGAITVDGTLNVKAAANVHGENTAPPAWSGCDASQPGMAALVAPPGHPDPVTIAKPGNVTSPAGNGSLAVLHDPAAGNSSTYVAYGDETWNTLVGMANAVFQGASSPNPAPSLVAGSCNKGDVNNWGEPHRLPIDGGTDAGAVNQCYNYFPIVYVNGDMSAHGGRGQGILLVNGNVKINGGFEWNGLMIVKGDITQGTGGAVVNGGIMAQNNAGIGTGEDLNGNITINYSQCALDHAMRGSAQVVQAKERAWTELY